MDCAASVDRIYIITSAATTFQPTMVTFGLFYRLYVCAVGILQPFTSAVQHMDTRLEIALTQGSPVIRLHRSTG